MPPAGDMGHTGIRGGLQVAIEYRRNLNWAIGIGQKGDNNHFGGDERS